MNFGILVYGGAVFLFCLGAWKLYHYMQDRMRRVRERLRMDELVSFVARPEKISEMDFTVISTPVDVPKPKLSKRARRCKFLRWLLRCEAHFCIISAEVVLVSQKGFLHWLCIRGSGSRDFEGLWESQSPRWCYGRNQARTSYCCYGPIRRWQDDILDYIGRQGLLRFSDGQDFDQRPREQDSKLQKIARVCPSRRYYAPHSHRERYTHPICLVLRLLI